ncbi:helix-turn-helix domain-containing protein [Clostridioides difficile]|uniref:helix-turn-helix domain-containing protein n=1 Tax=Clostridioides difficile TaxID=1496 RepID=UPI000CDEA731|nr:helix-turn-helix transcriptional regulator [Clostridioides difficile]MCO4409187.1 helix-turn-helix domain-containing protein [Clostridioides difficile]HBF5908434.1 helix-turn-helix domain-containing protein [Clostridioides difficile]HBF6217472.1 helix-turn-helix domain-containing protein [Clostridioides difficile]HBF6292083.1 helix-turn-helix domain-containing protein [Clostridioides difficile]HBF6482857.1 helix-turn-helix domain-containing protein [Clostridioides difficile]
MKLTEFGKFSRKLRIEHGELLKDMAEKLNVTVSYLSAVETGKRNVPEKWHDIMVNKYNLKDEEKRYLEEAIFNSAIEIRINTNELEETERDLVFSFARRFRDLDNEDRENIRNILSRNKE